MVDAVTAAFVVGSTIFVVVVRFLPSVNTAAA